MESSNAGAVCEKTRNRQCQEPGSNAHYDAAALAEVVAVSGVFSVLFKR